MSCSSVVSALDYLVESLSLEVSLDRYELPLHHAKKYNVELFTAVMEMLPIDDKPGQYLESSRMNK